MTPILNIAHQLLLKNETKGDLSWVLRTFSNLSDGGNQQIQKILDLSCVEKIVSLLNPKESSQVITPALRTIGNLSTGTNSQVETLMKLDIIESVVPLLCHSAKVIRREAAWALSNIISAGEECIASVFNFGNGQILDRLFHMIDEEDFEVQIILLNIYSHFEGFKGMHILLDKCLSCWKHRSSQRIGRKGLHRTPCRNIKREYRNKIATKLFRRFRSSSKRI